MSIHFDDEKKVFLLNTPSSTYAMRIFENNYLLHCGWYDRIEEWSDICGMPMLDRAFSPVPADLYGKHDCSFDSQMTEFATTGSGDFRNSSIEVKGKDGTIAFNAKYKAHRIYEGKNSIPGLPSTFVNSKNEADTLEVDLVDEASNVQVTLVYTVWNNLDVICRNVILKNLNDSGSVNVQKIMSSTVDFAGSDFKLLQLSGSWARERHVITRDLVPGLQGVESRRNTSSHQQNPFIALMDFGATEETGNVFGFSFVYSGNFTAQVEVDQYNMSRVQMGINPFNFEWKLGAGEVFHTPEVVMVYSNKGLGQMSRTYHDLYRNNLCRGKWSKMERPIVINNWEATYFDFNEEKLFALADTAAKQGIELFVLDDGWFGVRNDDRTSLGDWVENRNKIKGGLKAIADGMHARGLKFGLWFEPEMISPDSDLFRAHPDWALHIDGRTPSLGRHQYVLDYSRKDVTDYIIQSLSAIFDAVDIDYVKWDFNRSPTEIGSALASPDEQMMVSHKFYLGLYRVMEALTTKYENILFESCSGGGGRFDPGMFHYMNQAWTSDDTDAVSRVAIQMGSSVVYPASGMSCHVSAVPNHQIGRVTSFKQRGECAMAGTFGYELDLNRLPKEELDEVKVQCELYKRIRKTVQYGDLYRLKDVWAVKSAGDPSQFGAWEYVSKDKKQAVLTVVWTLADAHSDNTLFKWKGLNPDAEYVIHVAGEDVLNWEGRSVKGSVLMNAGMFAGAHPRIKGSLLIVAEAK